MQNSIDLGEGGVHYMSKKSQSYLYSKLFYKNSLLGQTATTKGKFHQTQGKTQFLRYVRWGN